MNNSKVSIYVPVYNGQNTIELCINSILSQTVKPDKILVINDNSTDETAKILTKYSDKIEIIHHKKKTINHFLSFFSSSLFSMDSLALSCANVSISS